LRRFIFKQMNGAAAISVTRAGVQPSMPGLEAVLECDPECSQPAKTVLQMIKDNNETAAKGQRPGRLIVDPELVVRDSTARPALARTIRSSAKAN
jgi:hypothetical protein